MNYFFSVFLILAYGSGVRAQSTSFWQDSSQVNHSNQPLYVANDVIVSLREVNTDFVTSIHVSNPREAASKKNCLTKHGQVSLKVDQQFDVITPKRYAKQKKISDGRKKLVYLLNGCLVSDTTQISKAAICKSYILSAKDPINADKERVCLSLWTISAEERGIAKDSTQIYIK